MFSPFASACDDCIFYPLCCDFPCSASVPSEPNKRHCSHSTVDLEDRSHKRRHCSSNGRQLHAEGDGTCSRDVNSKPLQSRIINQLGDGVSKCSTKVITCWNYFHKLIYCKTLEVYVCDPMIFADKFG